MGKTYHMAAAFNDDGDVSPLCAKTPKAINLKRASWTVRKDAVTCRRCKAILVTLADEDTLADGD